jgi:hypothetical protein
MNQPERVNAIVKEEIILSSINNGKRFSTMTTKPLIRKKLLD